MKIQCLISFLVYFLSFGIFAQAQAVDPDLSVRWKKAWAQESNTAFAVACPGKAPEALDLFEGRSLRHFEVDKSLSTKVYPEIAYQVLLRLRDVTQIRLQSDPFEFEKLTVFAQGGIIVDSFDSAVAGYWPKVSLTPIPSDCQLLGVGVASPRYGPPGTKYLINKDIWDQMSEVSKAAVFLDLLLLTAQEAHDGGQGLVRNGISARMVTSLFMSGAFEDFGTIQFAEFNRGGSEWLLKSYLGGQFRYRNREPDLYLPHPPPNEIIYWAHGLPTYYPSGEIKSIEVAPGTDLYYKEVRYVYLFDHIEFYINGEIKFLKPTAAGFFYLPLGNPKEKCLYDFKLPEEAKPGIYFYPNGGAKNGVCDDQWLYGPNYEVKCFGQIGFYENGLIQHCQALGKIQVGGSWKPIGSWDPKSKQEYVDLTIDSDGTPHITTP